MPCRNSIGDDEASEISPMAHNESQSPKRDMLRIVEHHDSWPKSDKDE